jgi:DNA polymerase III alpha subunit
MDIIAQGGLAVMRDARGWLADRGVATDLKALPPWEDPEVWDLLCGEQRGVHHVESPAMISLSRMLHVRDIDTLVAQAAAALERAEHPA